MFFTSGTTGNPKGVVHTHVTLLDRAKAGADFDQLSEREEVLAYLPPAWIGQNIFSYAQWLACGYVVNCPESAATVTIDLKEIGPTYYFAPPRIFEGLLTSVMIRMEDAGAVKKWLFQRFMAVARRVGPATAWTASRWACSTAWPGPLGDWLHLRAAAQYAGLFARARGLHRGRGHRPGPVQLLPLHRHQPQAALRQHRDGRLRVPAARPRGPRRHRGRADAPAWRSRWPSPARSWSRAPGLLKGYYKNDAATAEVLTADGWYHTGDAGFMDASGHLKIIDRAKDVGRIVGGAHRRRDVRAQVRGEQAEVLLRSSRRRWPLATSARSVCAFVNIDFEAVGNWAEKRNLPYAGYTDLAQKPEVYELIRDCVEKVNADLAQDAMLSGSQITRFLVLHKELDADDGEMTRTRKVKRGFINEKYRVLVDALYATARASSTSRPRSSSRTGARDQRLGDAEADGRGHLPQRGQGGQRGP